MAEDAFSFMVTISRLERVTGQALGDINHLLPQLSQEGRAFSLKELQETCKQKNLVWLTVKEGKHIIGVASLCMMRKFIGLCATIEDVVIDERYRGKGIGKLLMEKLISQARKRGVLYIDLTSRPEREQANAFYQALGFKKRDTNVYRLKIKNPKLKIQNNIKV